MSNVIGMMLHTALTKAGHPEWYKWDAWYSVECDEMIVQFHRGQAPDGACVRFSLPAHLTDPVAYAKAKWPEWFVAKRELSEQLDLFNQEQSI